jgi:hypothetical protein
MKEIDIKINESRRGRIVIGKATEIMDYVEFKKHAEVILGYFEREKISTKQGLFILWCLKQTIEENTGVRMSVITDEQVKEYMSK